MAFWSKLSRPNWLQELQGLLVAGLVIAGIISVVVVVDLAGNGSVTVAVEASDVAGNVGDDLPNGARIEPDQPVDVVVDNPDTGQWASYILSSAPTPVLIVVVIAMLLRIVIVARRSDPFSSEAARQLRHLGLVALIGGLAVNVVELLASLHLSGSVGNPQAVWQPPVWWVLVGFVTFTVAEIVRRGHALREELETVV